MRRLPTLSLFILVVAFFAAIFIKVYQVYTVGSAEKTTVSNGPEKYFKNVTADKDVAINYIPVIIHRKGAIGDKAFAGVGSLLPITNGEFLLITAADVFSSTENGPSNTFFISRLRPHDRNDEYGLMALSLPNSDVIVGMVGGTVLPVACYKEDQGARRRREIMTNFVPVIEARSLRLIMSDEKCPLIATGPVDPDGSCHGLIIRESKASEAGAGLIDERGGLYVLVGPSLTMDMTPLAADRMGYPRNAYYSVVVGPVNTGQTNLPSLPK